MERDLMTLAIPSPLVSCPPGSPQGSLFVVGSQAPVSPRLTWIYAFLRSLSMCLQLSLGNGEQTQDKTAFPLPHFLPKDTASTNSDALTLLHHMIERILESLPLTAPLTLKSEESHRLEETLQAFTTFAHSALHSKSVIRQEVPSLSSLLKPQQFEQNWHSERLLGRGGFGQVLQARDKSTDRRYAVKVVSVEDPTHFPEAYREVQAMSQLDHPHVVRFNSAWVEEASEYHEETFFADNASQGTCTLSSSGASECTFSEYSVGNLLDDSMSSVSTLEFASADNSWSQESASFLSSATPSPIESEKSENPQAVPECKAIMVVRPCNPQTAGLCGPAMMWQIAFSSHLRATRVRADLGLAKPAVSSLNSSLDTAVQEKKNKYALFIQMELCGGETLEQWLHRSQRTIHKKENLDILLQIAEGLEYIHDCGLVHRDMKPANIFMDDNKNVKIGDFGLSRDVQSLKNSSLLSSRRNGSSSSKEYTVGTPGYVAPEIKEGLAYDGAVDVYSLGIILMEMFTQPSTRHERSLFLSQLHDSRNVDFIADADIADLVLSMTEPNPTNRVRLDELKDRIVDISSGL